MPVILNDLRGHRDPDLMMDVWTRTLLELAKEDRSLVVLDSAPEPGRGAGHFADKNPTRYFDCGPNARQMVGIGAGLAAAGKRVFGAVSADSVERDAAAILRLAVLPKASMVLAGLDPGVICGLNAGPVLSCRDGAAFRGVPGVTILDPADPVQLRTLLRGSPDREGLTYLRLPRRDVKKVYESGSTFAVGRMPVLMEGSDVMIVASGVVLDEALQAAEQLAGEGISAAVLDGFSWQPLDRETLALWAGRTGAVVTAENHSRTGGLGTAVAEALAELCPVPLERAAVPDGFAGRAVASALMDRCALRAPDIAAAVRRVMERK